MQTELAGMENTMAGANSTAPTIIRERTIELLSELGVPFDGHLPLLDCLGYRRDVEAVVGRMLVLHACAAASKRSPAEGHRPDAGDIVPGWRC